MPKSLTAAASPSAFMQLMVGLAIGLTFHISAATTVDICSEGRTRINGRSVNISSPNYPSTHRINDGIICSCHVTTGQNSRDNIRIEPKDIAYSVSSTACYASIELWDSGERADKKFCLNSPYKNFSSGVQFTSVFLTNITYQAYRPENSRINFQGKFLISVSASRATNLLLTCTSFPSTSPATQVITSTSRATSTISRTVSRRTNRISSTIPISNIVTSSRTAAISSTVRGSSTSRTTSTITVSSPISSTTLPLIGTTIPISSTSPVLSTTNSISSTTSPVISTINPISSTTSPIKSTINLISSTSIILSAAVPSSSQVSITSQVPISSAIYSSIRTVRYSSAETTNTTTGSMVESSTLNTMDSSTIPQVDGWSSTENFTSIIALRRSNDDYLLWILIGVLLPIAVIAMIATIVIACRVKKSKKHSADGIMVVNYWGRNADGSLSALINKSFELRSRKAEGCTAQPTPTVVVFEKGNPPTPKHQAKRQSSNYTPMNQNSPKMTSKTSLSASVYADIEEIESQRNKNSSVVFRGNAALPTVRVESCDNVYYNAATTDPSSRAESRRRSEINAYETCYSPEIDGVTSLHPMGLNSSAYDVYASIHGSSSDVSELPTDGQKGNVSDQDDGDYCNVVGQRGDGAASRKSSGAEVTLVENQLYS